MKRIKAFTLIELIIVMIISSILITFVWSAYSYLQRINSENRIKNQNIVNFISFEKQLRRDIECSEKVLQYGKGIHVDFGSYITTYEFRDDFIVRNQLNRIDTLRCELLETNYSLLGNSLFQPKIVNDLFIKLKILGKNMELVYSKKYDSKFLFHYEKLDNMK